MADSLRPERLPKPPAPQTEAGRQRVHEISTDLVPGEAQRVIAEIVDDHGLGREYVRDVRPARGGRWLLVAPDGSQTAVDAMPEPSFRRWLQEEYFADAIRQGRSGRE